MGNRNFKDNIKSSVISNKNNSNDINSSKKILCLHGWRTSGSILSMQTAALRANVDIKCQFIDAPFDSEVYRFIFI